MGISGVSGSGAPSPSQQPNENIQQLLEEYLANPQDTIVQKALQSALEKIANARPPTSQSSEAANLLNQMSQYDNLSQEIQILKVELQNQNLSPQQQAELENQLVQATDSKMNLQMQMQEGAGKL